MVDILGGDDDRLYLSAVDEGVVVGVNLWDVPFVGNCLRFLCVAPADCRDASMRVILECR
jgi:hypothetical protein